MTGRKTTGANTVYKLWLGISSLGKSCGFSKAGFYQERSVPGHATAYIHKRWLQFDKNPVKKIKLTRSLNKYEKCEYKITL